MPVTLAATMPAAGESVAKVTAIATNAPASSLPSSPMLITPARSAMTSPSAARSKGAAILTVDWRRLAIRLSMKQGLGVVLAEPLPALQRHQGQDDGRLNDRDEDRRHAGAA